MPLCSVCNKEQTIITDPHSGEIICSQCGVVILDKIPQSGPYPRAEGASSDRGRTDMSNSLARHDMGFSTVIGLAHKDANGQTLDAAMLHRIKRLRTWDRRIHACGSTGSLAQAFNELDRLNDKLRLPDAVIQRTARVYRKAEEKGIIQGRSISTILAAALYIACRQMGTPRTLNEIVAGTANVKRRNLTMGYRLLVQELGLKIPVVDPVVCIAKIANKVNLSEKTKRQAMNIMHHVLQKEISGGKNPMCLAASVIYLSCVHSGENKTQKDIVQASGISQVTIINRSRELNNRIRLDD
ncbi:MAG: transcription initiation factor IIB [Thermoproteota archaeon]|nr:transcription initiation factor IIB [Thermoproteota archaeon]